MSLSQDVVLLATYRCPLRISSPRTIMSTVPSASTSNSNFVSIFNAALQTYKHKTKKDLASHPLLPSLQSCGSPEAILAVLREQIPVFSQSQNDDDKLTKWVTPTVNVLYSFSATLGGAVGLVNIGCFLVNDLSSNIYLSGIPSSEHNLYGNRRSPLGLCPSWFPYAAHFDAYGFQAVNDARVSQDKLIELFNRIERFFGRLEIYTGITPTRAMTDVLIEIMVEVLTILAIATKEVKRGGLSKLMSRGLPFLTDTLFRKVYQEVNRKHRHRG